MLSPLGADVASTWEGILAGRSGIRQIDHFDTENFSTKFAGLVPDFAMDEYLSGKEARKMDVFVQYGMVAAIQALRDAGLEMDKENGERIGVAIGSGIGGLTNIEENHQKLMDSGPRKLSPFFVPSTIINMIAGNLAIMYGFKGPNFATVTACTILSVYFSTSNVALRPPKKRAMTRRIGTGHGPRGAGRPDQYQGVEPGRRS